MILRILLLPLLRPHLLFHLKLLGHIQAPLHRRPLIDRVQPLLDLQECVKLDAGSFGIVHLSERR